MIKVAVLSSRYQNTVKWLALKYRIVKLEKHSRVLTDENGIEYHIVQEKRHANGIEFHSYIKAPDYESLEDVVISRIHTRIR